MIKRNAVGLIFMLGVILGGWLPFSAGCAFAADSPDAKLQRPPIVGVANIALHISNLARSKQFYSGGLGFDLAFTTKDPDGRGTSYFKVNDHQYIELTPDLRPNEDRLIHIGLETTNARQLRTYLAAHRVKVPPRVGRLPDGSLGFEMPDPDGQEVQFVQYIPGSDEARDFGKFLSPRRISKVILHLGVIVQNQARADAYYQTILGLDDFWDVWAVGGCCIDMRVPNGSDWVEYMMHPRPLPPSRTGGAHHFSLGMISYPQTYKEVLARGLKPAKAPKIGHDGKWEFNLFDPDGTRVEFMTINTVRPPNPPFFRR